MEKVKSKGKKWNKWKGSLRPGPKLDTSIISSMSPMIRGAIGLSPDPELDDVVLLGLITTSSALLPTVRGKFGGKKYGPNLYMMFLAPPASNKSLIDQIVNCTEDIDIDLNCGNYQKGDKSLGKRRLRVSGNISKAALIEQIAQMPSCSLIYESEIDTASHVLGQEWGGHSDILRSIYEHETISSTRKGKSPVIVRQPCATMILTGTDSQVHGMIEDINNGLASRFIYYSYRFDQYISEFDRKRSNAYSVQAKLRTELRDFFAFHYEHSEEFYLTDGQLKSLDVIFQDLHDRFIDQPAFKATALRLKTVLFRICMILGAFDKWHNNDIRPKYRCSKRSFDVAVSIVQTLLEHAIVVQSFIDRSKVPALPIEHRNVLDNLGETYTTKELYAVFAEHMPQGVNKTARNWNDTWLTKGITMKLSHGKYRKV